MSETAIKYTQRRCNFQGGDGSPAFSEYQYERETLDDFVARMLDVRAQAQGHLIIAGWQRIEVYDDPDAAELALDDGSDEPLPCICGHAKGDHIGRMDDCTVRDCPCPLYALGNGRSRDTDRYEPDHCYSCGAPLDAVGGCTGSCDPADDRD